jgi:hypothetical protein
MSLDILNDSTPVDLSTVRTAMPVLKPALHEAVVKNITIESNKAQTGSNMNLEYTLTNQAEAVDGKIINPGFTVFDTVSLVRTFKEDGTTVKYEPMSRLVEIYEAITGEKSGTMTARALVDNLTTFIGRKIAFRTKVESDAQYGDKTRIAKYVKTT